MRIWKWVWYVTCNTPSDWAGSFRSRWRTSEDASRLWERPAVFSGLVKKNWTESLITHSCVTNKERPVREPTAEQVSQGWRANQGWVHRRSDTRRMLPPPPKRVSCVNITGQRRAMLDGRGRGSPESGRGGAPGHGSCIHAIFGSPPCPPLFILALCTMVHSHTGPLVVTWDWLWLKLLLVQF